MTSPDCQQKLHREECCSMLIHDPIITPLNSCLRTAENLPLVNINDDNIDKLFKIFSTSRCTPKQTRSECLTPTVRRQGGFVMLTEKFWHRGLSSFVFFEWSVTENHSGWSPLSHDETLTVHQGSLVKIIVAFTTCFDEVELNQRSWRRFMIIWWEHAKLHVESNLSSGSSYVATLPCHPHNQCQHKTLSLRCPYKQRNFSLSLFKSLIRLIKLDMFV